MPVAALLWIEWSLNAAVWLEGGLRKLYGCFLWIASTLFPYRDIYYQKLWELEFNLPFDNKPRHQPLSFSLPKSCPSAQLWQTVSASGQELLTLQCRCTATPIILPMICDCLPAPTADFCSCEEDGSQSLNYLLSLPLQKQIDNSCFKILRWASNLNCPASMLCSTHCFSLAVTVNSHICKSMWLSIVHAMGRINLDTILILME